MQNAPVRHDDGAVLLGELDGGITALVGAVVGTRLEDGELLIQVSVQGLCVFGGATVTAWVSIGSIPGPRSASEVQLRLEKNFRTYQQNAQWREQDVADERVDDGGEGGSKAVAMRGKLI